MGNNTQQHNGSNFHSSGLRQKIDLLMDILWAGGVNNPMDSIEQISYLLFLRLLTERDDILASLQKKGYQRIFSGSWARYAWGNFVTLTGDQLFDAVRSAIESIHELPGLSGTGKLLFNRATLKIYDRPTLRAVVQAIHEMDLASHNGHDIKGDMYEYLLSKLQLSGTNGQFRTPRHIIAMIVALVDPKPGMRICDPACGTAGFLIAAYNHILRQNTSKAALAKGDSDGDLLKPAQWRFLEEHAFTGYDNDANMVKIAILNLYLHKLERANIELHNPLTTSKGNPYPGFTFDTILANPPFAGQIQKESILADINLETRDTELLFLKWFLDHLNPVGRAGVIVPNGVFKPYSGVGTAALILEKCGTGVPPVKDHGQDDHATEFVWFYDLTADGFSLDDKRAPIEANDIPDVLAKWPKREEGPNSYRVPIEKIREHDWSLASGRYKPVVVETVKHDAPAKIVGAILSLEKQITEEIQKLMEKL
ncbi:MAG TPA: class I SAM-dependent DNA methyltransferase [Terriglobia bacterium]|nr:class I SAM-dependent DNA methyltransferase [Terriglobia bacterium]